MVLTVPSLKIAALVFLSSYGWTRAQDNPLNGLNVNDVSFGDIFSLQSSSVDPNGDIDRIAAHLNGLITDRANVPDIGTDFNLRDCYLEGLSSGFERAGNVSLEIVERVATLSFGVTLKDLSLTCAWKTKIFVFYLAGTATASSSKVSASATVSVNLHPGEHPNLDEFRVLRLEKIDMTFTGLGFLNQVANAIGEAVINTSRARIIEEIEVAVPKALQNLFRSLKVPKI